MAQAVDKKLGAIKKRSYYKQYCSNITCLINIRYR